PFLLPLLGWNAGWVVAAVASAGLALVLGWETRGLRPPPARPQGSRLLGDFREVLAQPGAWLCAAMFGFYSSTFMAVFGFLPTFLVERQGIGLTAAILLSAFGVLMNAPGNIAGGWLARQGVPRWGLIMIGCTTMALSSLGIFSDALPVWARYALALSFSFVGGFIPATIFGIAPSFAPRPDLVSTVAGFVVQGSSIGQLLGPPVMAALVAYVGGWQAAPLLLTGAGCVNIVLALLLRRLERRRCAVAVA
ncbi:MAG TPA: MFS transporter, partial [Azospirillaceae bacterium]|nr:MFS transporter [Azospirillaceae bacterium]